MLKDVIIGSILIITFIILFFNFVDFITSGYQMSVENQLQYNATKQAISEVFGNSTYFVESGKQNVDSVETNPNIAEGQDIMSIFGRYATLTVKIFTEAYLLPIKIIQTAFILINMESLYESFKIYIEAIYLGLVLFAILSIITRYPID